MMRVVWIALGTLTVAATGAWGQATAPDALARGKKLFESKGLCFTCHGQGGEGLLGPTTRLAGRPLVHTKPTVADISALIRAGIPATSSTSGQVMPPRGGSRLTDAEVELVATYVKDLNGRKK